MRLWTGWPPTRRPSCTPSSWVTQPSVPPQRPWSTIPSRSYATPIPTTPTTTLASPSSPYSETIYALSSAPGRAGVAVFRVSGPQALQAITHLSSLTLTKVRPRYAHLVDLHRPGDPKDTLDTALVLYFPGPRSFTGEDTVELHVHGGRAVVAAVSEALSSLPSTRPAEAGEFTRRAFEHGKMDLTQIEGLGDLLAAETEAQRRQALVQSKGVAKRMFEGWREDIIASLASVEAVIDFGEDEDIPAETLDEVCRRIKELGHAISHQLVDGRRGERLRSGLRVTLCGAPNAGKSSLLNQLVEREAAIVSPEAGTTRDIVEVALDIKGLPVLLSDTAGLRNEGYGKVEAEGIRRAKARMEESDMVILLVDPTLTNSDQLSRYMKDMMGGQRPHIIVINKVDLLGKEERDGMMKRVESMHPSPAEHERILVHAVSCQTGQEIPALVDTMAQCLLTMVPSDTGRGALEGVITQARHRQHLTEAKECLDRAEEWMGEDVVLAAEELRGASLALGKLTGRIEVEEVLGKIFSSFCIGK